MYRISYNKLHKNVHFSNLYKSSKQVEAHKHTQSKHPSRIHTVGRRMMNTSITQDTSAAACAHINAHFSVFRVVRFLLQI